MIRVALIDPPAKCATDGSPPARRGTRQGTSHDSSGSKALLAGLWSGGTPELLVRAGTRAGDTGSKSVLPLAARMRSDKGA
jgi:hypothetical protein